MCALERELAELREKSSGMKAQWQKEKEVLASVGKIKQQIEQARIQADQATRTGDLGKAAEITYGTIPLLERQLRDTELKLAGNEQRYASVSARGGDGGDDVAEVVARWTGIPVSRMMEGERERLTKLESELCTSCHWPI